VHYVPLGPYATSGLPNPLDVEDSVLDEAWTARNNGSDAATSQRGLCAWHPTGRCFALAGRASVYLKHRPVAATSASASPVDRSVWREELLVSRDWSAHAAGFVLAVAWSPCGRFLASAGLDRRVVLWDVAEAHVATAWIASAFHLEDLAFASYAGGPVGGSVTEPLLALADGRGRVGVWGVNLAYSVKRVLREAASDSDDEPPVKMSDGQSDFITDDQLDFNTDDEAVKIIAGVRPPPRQAKAAAAEAEPGPPDKTVPDNSADDDDDGRDLFDHNAGEDQSLVEVEDEFFDHISDYHEGDVKRKLSHSFPVIRSCPAAWNGRHLSDSVQPVAAAEPYDGDVIEIEDERSEPVLDLSRRNWNTFSLRYQQELGGTLRRARRRCRRERWELSCVLDMVQTCLVEFGLDVLNMSVYQIIVKLEASTCHYLSKWKKPIIKIITDLVTLLLQKQRREASEFEDASSEPVIRCLSSQQLLGVSPREVPYGAYLPLLDLPTEPLDRSTSSKRRARRRARRLRKPFVLDMVQECLLDLGFEVLNMSVNQIIAKVEAATGTVLSEWKEPIKKIIADQAILLLKHEDVDRWEFYVLDMVQECLLDLGLEVLNMSVNQIIANVEESSGMDLSEWKKPIKKIITDQATLLSNPVLKPSERGGPLSVPFKRPRREITRGPAEP